MSVFQHISSSFLPISRSNNVIRCSLPLFLEKVLCFIHQWPCTLTVGRIQGWSIEFKGGLCYWWSVPLVVLNLGNWWNSVILPSLPSAHCKVQHADWRMDTAVRTYMHMETNTHICFVFVYYSAQLSAKLTVPEVVVELNTGFLSKSCIVQGYTEGKGRGPHCIMLIQRVLSAGYSDINQGSWPSHTSVESTIHKLICWFLPSCKTNIPLCCHTSANCLKVHAFRLLEMPPSNSESSPPTSGTCPWQMTRRNIILNPTRKTHNPCRQIIRFDTLLGSFEVCIMHYY